MANAIIVNRLTNRVTVQIPLQIHTAEEILCFLQCHVKCKTKLNRVIPFLGLCVLLKPAFQNACFYRDARLIKFTLDKPDFGIRVCKVAGIALLHNKLIQCGVKCPEGTSYLKQLLYVVLILWRNAIALLGQKLRIISHTHPRFRCISAYFESLSLVLRQDLHNIFDMAVQRMTDPNQNIRCYIVATVELPDGIITDIRFFHQVLFLHIFINEKMP